MNQTKIDHVETALFGDVRTGDVGLKRKVDEMHDLMIQGNAIRKFVFWLFGALTATAVAVFEIVKYFKSDKH